MPSIATSDNSSGKIKKELSDTKQSVETLSQIITDLKKENEELKARFAQNNLTMMMIDGKAMARENEIEVALSQLSKEVESLKKQLKTKIPSE
jgi:predicted RNase H-like nuclease (RuvC/YqgF family)